MNIKKIIREVIENNPHNNFMTYDDYLDNSNTDLCTLVAPKGTGKGGYISNEEAAKLINQLEFSSNKYIKDPKKLKEFRSVIEKFESDIKRTDTNLDTIDTYLHKLRTITGC